MTPCKACGTPYAQRVENGMVLGVNIDPVSGLCVSCLVASAKAQIKPMEPEAFDARKRASNDDA